MHITLADCFGALFYLIFIGLAKGGLGGVFLLVGVCALVRWLCWEFPIIVVTGLLWCLDHPWEALVETCYGIRGLLTCLCWELPLWAMVKILAYTLGPIRLRGSIHKQVAH